MPEWIERASADYVLDQLGLDCEREEDGLAFYKSRFNAYERAVVDFSTGRIRLDDFREVLLSEGLERAVVDAAIEQLSG